MDRFESIFGIDTQKVRETVLLLPFLPPRALEMLGVTGLSKGSVFASSSTDALTIVKTGIGPGFVGDAVLYLNDTPCRKIIFLGSCGLITPKSGITIGSLVIPKTALGLESFSDIVTNRLQDPIPVYPDEKLLNEFLKTTGLELPRLNCVSFCSLHQEESFVPLFQRLKADVIEMECAALFHAARKIDKPAIALLFVSDILGEKPFHKKLDPKDEKNLADGVSQACQAIQKFVKPNGF